MIKVVCQSAFKSDPPLGREDSWGSRVKVEGNGTGEQIKPEGGRRSTGDLICWPVLINFDQPTGFGRDG